MILGEIMTSPPTAPSPVTLYSRFGHTTPGGPAVLQSARRPPASAGRIYGNRRLLLQRVNPGVVSGVNLAKGCRLISIGRTGPGCR